MPDTPSFDLPEDRQAAAAFLKQGYCIVPVEDRAALDRIRALIAGAAAAFLGQPAPQDPDRFLNQVHDGLKLEQLNPLRLAVINAIRQADWFRPA
jgi:hypothetical protein